MRRGLLATGVVAFVAGLLAVSGSAGSSLAGTPSEATFRLGDGSAACAFDGSRLACRTTDARSAVVLDDDGRTYADDVDVDWTPSTPVLHSSESWFHGGFVCGVEAAEIVCTTLSGGVLAAG